MFTLLLIIHIFVSLFLIFIILIQGGKGEGLSDVFGGGSSQSTIFGTRTGTFLTRLTTISAIIFMLTSLSLAFMSSRRGGSVLQRELMKEKLSEDLKKILPEEKEPAPGPEAPVEPAAPTESGASSESKTPVSEPTEAPEALPSTP